MTSPDTDGTGHADHEHDEQMQAILAARARLWRRMRSHLAPTVAAYAATAPADLIRAAIDPHAHRTVRKAQAALAIATTLQASGHATVWNAANTANRDAAYELGVHGGAHQLSGGEVPLADPEPATEEKRRRRRKRVAAAVAAAIAALVAALIAKRRARTTAEFTEDLDKQVDGLAGDLADLYTTNPDDVTDDDVAQALDDAKGVWANSDVQWAEEVLVGANALYAALGGQLVNWYCCEAGRCDTCQDVVDASPYLITSAPGAIHPRCAPWTEPADIDPAALSPADIGSDTSSDG